MKNFSEAAMEEIAAGTAVVTGAVEIHADPVVRVWGGWGTLPLAGEDFIGIGDRGLAQISSRALGSTEQNVDLSLSGIEPEAIELLDAAELRDAQVVVYRLIFKGDSKTLLDAQVFDRGRLDDIVVEEVVGGPAALRIKVESAARGLGRRGGRMRTDADQRLIKSNDGFFRNVSYAGEKTLYWGGQRPARVADVWGGGTASLDGGYNFYSDGIYQ